MKLLRILMKGLYLFLLATSAVIYAAILLLAFGAAALAALFLYPRSYKRS